VNVLFRTLYAGAVSLARLATAVAPASDRKLWRAFRARRGLLDRWAAIAPPRDPSRPLVWLHAPSVGEGLQARPVAHALRDARADVQQAYSFFSPSAERFATSIGAECTEYLPFDGAREADRLLSLLQPHLLVFVKLDVWPTLVARAVARGVPVAMLSATLSATSRRRSVVSRALLRDAYASLSLVGAIDADNAERLVALGVPRDRVRVTGDTRFDQVWQRAQRVDRGSALLTATASDRPTLVAGSTWPSDEAVLLPAWATLRRSVPRARLIIAPHEPTAAHLTPIMNWARASGLRVSSLGELERRLGAAAEDPDVIVVDRVGVLGDLYAHATAAFVGGGFHRAGLHSAIEPAAFGAPILFGPGHQMSREAGLLLAAGGAGAVPDASTLSAALATWLGDMQMRSSAGAAARTIVEQERGATARSVALLTELLG
jgi:3-deoxy-D-manno-octulosonic-acid transferase